MSNAAKKMNLGHNESTGGRLVTADGRTLALRGATLRADARGGIARVVLEQTFENTFAEPLAVTYLMPLPADGAVSGYAFTIGEQRIVGEVDRRQAARERFEEAIASGHTAALVEQERSSLFTQEIGNIPAGSKVVAELVIDQKLAWLDEGAWEWRFPMVAMPCYMGIGRVADALVSRSVRRRHPAQHRSGLNEPLCRGLPCPRSWSGPCSRTRHHQGAMRVRRRR